MGRIAALDFGRARIGVALSDERRILATPLPFIPNDRNAAKALYEQLSKRGPLDALVLGLPLLFNGTEGEMAVAVRTFAETLQPYFTIPIFFWDERLTTAQVERTLKDADVSRKKRAPIVDSLCAALILQSYLDSTCVSV